MRNVVINHNFVFVPEALAALKSVGYGDDLQLTGFPAETNLMLSVGDLIDFPEMERFMFVVTSRRFSFKSDGMDITYLIDLVSDNSNNPNIQVVK